MFGVVVCPRCGCAKGVELPKKVTACPCGFEIRVRPSRVKYETADARDLAAAVGRINAELRGGTEEIEALAAKTRKRSKDAYLRVVAAASRAGDRRQKIRAAAEGLAREFVLFTREDWARALELLGISQVEESLEELVRGNVVYEPRPGYFRTV
jgi:hypothetical protein